MIVDGGGKLVDENRGNFPIHFVCIVWYICANGQVIFHGMTVSFILIKKTLKNENKNKVLESLK